MENDLDWKRMVHDINELVNNDWSYDVECHLLPNAQPFTPEESKKMAEVIGQVYLIAHCISCTACRGKYTLPMSLDALK